MPDYECWCLWNADPDSDWDYNIAPSALALSADLQATLNAWAADFDKMLNMDDPADTSFASPAEHQAFVARGEELLARLRAELPNVNWIYQP